MAEQGTFHPVEAQDLFALLADRHTSRNHLSLVLRTDGRVDPDLLSRALRHCARIHPVLGCALRIRDDQALWESRDDLDSLPWCVLTESDTLEENEGRIREFVAEPFEIGRDPLVRAGVFRTGTDVVVLKMHHAAADGAGLRQLLHLVVRLYGEFREGRVPDAAPAGSDRGSRQLVGREEFLPWIQRKAAEGERLPTVAIPGTPGEDRDPTFLSVSIGPDRFRVLREHAKTRGATVNDLILAAHCRALGRRAELRDGVATVNLTVDLRRHLDHPQEGPLRNFSGGEFVSVSVGTGDSLESVLEGVLRETRGLKAGHPGVFSAFAIEKIRSLGWQGANAWFERRRAKSLESRWAVPYLSNLGVLSPEPLRLGDASVGDGFAVGQAMRHPGSILLAGTWAGALTISWHFFRGTFPESEVRDFLDGMAADLGAF